MYIPRMSSKNSASWPTVSECQIASHKKVGFQRCPIERWRRYALLRLQVYKVCYDEIIESDMLIQLFMHIKAYIQFNGGLRSHFFISHIGSIRTILHSLPWNSGNWLMSCNKTSDSWISFQNFEILHLSTWMIFIIPSYM